MIFHESVLQGINDLLQGGYMRQVAYAFFGKPLAGKTTLLLLEAYNFMAKTGKSVLFVDTEYDKAQFVYFYDKDWRKRFKISDKNRVHVVAPENMEEMLRFHGIEAKLERNPDTGKVMLEFYGQTMARTESGRRKKTVRILGKIEELIEKEDIGMIVYDSMTALLKADFVGGLKNYPARDDASVLLMTQILRLAKKYNLLVFATHHASIDPQKINAAAQIPGGAMLQYLSKVWFYLELTKYRRGTPMSGIRRLYLVRFFKTLSWARVKKIIFMDDVYQDITDEQVEEIKEQYEAEQKGPQRALLEKTKSKKKRG